MNNYSILKMFNSFEEKKLTFNCPSCNEKCDIDDEMCKYCSFELTKFKSAVFTPHLYYLDAYNQAKSCQWLDSLINIIKFLSLIPNDEDGNKLYIYLLVKNNFIEKAKLELEIFEKKFERNSWIMEVEKTGIENLEFPKLNITEIRTNETADPFHYITSEYLSYRQKNVNDIIEFALQLWNVVRIMKIDKKNKEILDFYNKVFLKFLSKKEIKIEEFDNKNYYELDEDTCKTIDVLEVVKNRKFKDGTMITVNPAIYLRTKLMVKAKVLVVNNRK